MKIAVGSTSPAKVGAVQKAASAYWGNAIEVIGIATGSGVSDQPIGVPETVRGAFNRARAALAATPGATMGIGLEGGVDTVEGHPMMIGYVAVVDTEGKESLAPSHGTPLPAAWMQKLLEGGELRPLVLEAGLPYDHTTGVVGILTNKQLSRHDAFAQAVLAALAPWVSPEAYMTEEIIAHAA